MTELPILLNTEMVKAVLAGRKTQTRLPIKMPEGISAKYEYRGDDGGNELLPKKSVHYWMNGYAMWRPNLLWQVGDRLYVREKWQPLYDCCGLDVIIGACFRYRGGGRIFNDNHEKSMHVDDTYPHRSGAIMPKWAARIWLEITDIRVERIQDITESDAKAEGIKPLPDNDNDLACYVAKRTGVLHKPAFSFLWDKLYKGSWERNDWVWVRTFKRIDK